MKVASRTPEDKFFHGLVVFVAMLFFGAFIVAPLLRSLGIMP